MTRRMALLAAVAAPLIGQKTEAELQEKIRKELITLPYYGCFDLLTFQLSGTAVKLGGYAMRPTLKDDAERVIKDLERVSKVENEIEVLPLSPNDDRIRWGVFRAIYRDPALSRYAPGGGLYMRRRGGTFFGGPFENWNMPAGTQEPLGSFPIHIIVQNGDVILVGVVDNKADADRANILANGVAGAMSVKNLIETAPPAKGRKR